MPKLKIIEEQTILHYKCSMEPNTEESKRTRTRWAKDSKDRSDREATGRGVQWYQGALLWTGAVSSFRSSRRKHPCQHLDSSPVRFPLFLTCRMVQSFFFFKEK